MSLTQNDNLLLEESLEIMKLIESIRRIAHDKLMFNRMRAGSKELRINLIY